MPFKVVVSTAVCLLTSSTIMDATQTAPAATPIPHWRPHVAIQQQQDSLGAQVFHRQCVPCHGKEGKGNGPAAVAFNPKPADLTDADRMGKLTDEELLTVIGAGRGSMPSFAAVLSGDELQAVSDYVRSLSRGADE